MSHSLSLNLQKALYEKPSHARQSRDFLSNNRYLSWLVPKEDPKPFCDLAKKLIIEIKNAPRLDPKTAKNSPFAKAARHFRKRHGQRLGPDSHQLQRLERVEMAYRLGIHSKILKHPNNSKFYKFAKKSRVDRYLALFHHQLKVFDNSILISKGGCFLRWQDISKTAFSLIEKIPQSPSIPWPYDGNGLLNKRRDVYQWDSLEPIWTTPPGETPFWGKKNIFRICIHAESADLWNNHSWYILYTADGKIYSFSKYRHPNLYTLGILEGHIQSGEVSNPWPDYSHRAFQTEITNEQCEKLLTIELEKKKKGPVPFHNLDNNCTQETLLRLQEIGIILPSCKVNVWRHILPLSLQNKIDSATSKLSPHLPPSINKIVRFSSTFFTSFVMLWFKPWEYSPKVANRGYFADPRLDLSGFFKDFTDNTKTRIISPYFLSHSVLPKDPLWKEMEPDLLSMKSLLT